MWRGETPAGAGNPFVPEGSREVPLLFGGAVQASYDRVALSGQGYIGGSVPAGMVAGAFDGVRAAWKEAGREGAPYLVAIAYGCGSSSASWSCRAPLPCVRGRRIVVS